MIFNEKTYYQYISFLEGISIILFIIYLAATSFISAILIKSQSNTLVDLIIGALFGVVTGIIPYILIQIKMEDMKWKLDIYNKVMNQNNIE